MATVVIEARIIFLRGIDQPAGLGAEGDLKADVSVLIIGTLDQIRRVAGEFGVLLLGKAQKLLYRYLLRGLLLGRFGVVGLLLGLRVGLGRLRLHRIGGTRGRVGRLRLRGRLIRRLCGLCGAGGKTHQACKNQKAGRCGL